MCECVSVLLDEVFEEECGVSDDASSSRLFMLAALEGEAIIHVALRVKAGLHQDRHRRTNNSPVVKIGST